MAKANENTAKAVGMANELLTFVNSYGFDRETFAKTICKGHRTLQQSVMRLFIEMIREMSKNSYDDRNEASVELAKRIMEIADGFPLPFI